MKGFIQLICVSALTLIFLPLSSAMGQGKSVKNPSRTIKSAKAKSQSKEQRIKLRQGRKALVQASKKAREGRPKTAEEKAKARTLAFHALVEVEGAYVGVPEIQAEAAFRQGKLLALLGRSKDAVAAYERASKVLPESYASKAIIQAGHVMRRMKKLGDALKYYRSAIKAGRGIDAQRARIWEGKVLAKLGRMKDARESWKSLSAAKDADPFQRIQAFDALAGSYLKSGDFRQVQIVLKDADETLSAVSSPEEKLGKRIQERLSRMSSRRRLRQKLEKAAPAKAGK